MKPKLVLLIGAPCSGKSKWARDQCIGNTEIIRVSVKEINFMLRGQFYTEKAIKDISRSMADIAISQALVKNKNVILDDCNTSDELLNYYIDSFGKFFDIYYKFFEVDVDKLIERSKERYQKQGIGYNQTEISAEASRLHFLKPKLRTSNKVKEYSPEINLSQLN